MVSSPSLNGTYGRVWQIVNDDTPSVSTHFAARTTGRERGNSTYPLNDAKVF
jgi:hypothetical protein